MSERIGYCGKVDGHKVFFQGEMYIALINGKNYVIDYESIPENRKQRLKKQLNNN